jgi:hypothetical protein
VLGLQLTDVLLALLTDGSLTDGAIVPELDEKAVAERDARIRSFAIAQVLPPFRGIPAYLPTR